MGWKKFQFGGERWPFCSLKSGVKEDDDGTIKQDEPREWALKRPSHRAKKPPNARYIAPIGRRGVPKTGYPRVSYLKGKRGKSIYNNVRAREKRRRLNRRRTIQDRVDNEVKRLRMWRSITRDYMHHHTALTLLFATFGLVIYTSKLPSPSVLMPCYVQGATKVYEKASDLTKKRRWPALAGHRLQWVRITIPTAEASTHT